MKMRQNPIKTSCYLSFLFSFQFLSYNLLKILHTLQLYDMYSVRCGGNKKQTQQTNKYSIIISVISNIMKENVGFYGKTEKVHLTLVCSFR